MRGLEEELAKYPPFKLPAPLAKMRGEFDMSGQVVCTLLQKKNITKGSGPGLI